MNEEELASNDEKLRVIRLVAEKHWEYTKSIIEKTFRYAKVRDYTEEEIQFLLDLLHTLYVEPFVHGYKHRLEEEGIIK
jgi:hypothetical protein